MLCNLLYYIRFCITSYKRHYIYECWSCAIVTVFRRKHSKIAVHCKWTVSINLRMKLQSMYYIKKKKNSLVSSVVQ